MVATTNYGVIGNLIVAFFKGISDAFKGWKVRRYNRRVGKLIKKAEGLRRLTGYRYFIIRFRGRIRMLPKKTLKEWIANGTFKKGTTIQDLENKAIYTTKILPKYQ